MGGEEPQQKEGRVQEVGQDWRGCARIKAGVRGAAAENPQQP